MHRKLLHKTVADIILTSHGAPNTESKVLVLKRIEVDADVQQSFADVQYNLADVKYSVAVAQYSLAEIFCWEYLNPGIGLVSRYFQLRNGGLRCLKLEESN
jgi:hypothetical protein